MLKLNSFLLICLFSCAAIAQKSSGFVEVDFRGVSKTKKVQTYAATIRVSEEVKKAQWTLRYLKTKLQSGQIKGPLRAGELRTIRFDVPLKYIQSPDLVLDVQFNKAESSFSQSFVVQNKK